jgi:DNA-binding CsgD family transcriptional regulator
MVESAPRSHEVRHLWRKHRVVIVEGPSGSGRSSTAFAAVSAEVAQGGCRGLIIEGAQGPDIDDLRLWIATRVAVARASGGAPRVNYAVVDDLHLLDDEAWGLVERLSRENDTYWVMTVASGTAERRVAALLGAGAGHLRVSTVSTQATREILREVWGHEPTPGMVDLVYQLCAGRPGWMHKWAKASAHVPAEAKLAGRGELTTYEWHVFQRAATLLGEGLGVGTASREAMFRVSTGAETPGDVRLLTDRGELMEVDYTTRRLVAVPLLRRLVVLNAETSQAVAVHPEDSVVAAGRWLEMFMPDGARRRLEGVAGASASLLRLESNVLLGESRGVRDELRALVRSGFAFSETELQRLLALGLAAEDRQSLDELRRHEHVGEILEAMDLAREGRIAEAARRVDVGAGPGTEAGAAGLAPLRRALAAWYAALGDDTLNAYRLMFGAPPSAAAPQQLVSPLWEALLGDLHALTCLLLGEWNRVGIHPEAFPRRANTWLRHDNGAWPAVAATMGVDLNRGRLSRSVFVESIHGLSWLTAFARVVADDAELTLLATLSRVRRPVEPGLARILSVWRARAELLQRGAVVRGSDHEEKAATSAGSSLARVQLSLWGLGALTPGERSTARATLARLGGVYGFDSWLSLPEEVGPAATGLSRREREVCVELAHGYTAAETAQRLGISPRTVEKHAANAYKKLDIASRQELAAALGVSLAGGVA